MNFPAGSNDPFDLLPGDYNGDDLPDLAVFGLNKSVILLGDGAGRFGAAGPITPPLNLNQGVSGDFNGDAIPDSVKGSLGAERLAPLFFVSPSQINNQMPPETAEGQATVTIKNGDAVVASGQAQISRVAPGLFAANADGQGVAAAIVLRVKADGSQVYESVARFDAATNRFVVVPIDLGDTSDQVFLILFGTQT